MLSNKREHGQKGGREGGLVISSILHSLLTYPLANDAPTSGKSTYTTSPSALAAKPVMPTVATSPSSFTHSWEVAYRVVARVRVRVS